MRLSPSFCAPCSHSERGQCTQAQPFPFIFSLCITSWWLSLHTTRTRCAGKHSLHKLWLNITFLWCTFNHASQSTAVCWEARSFLMRHKPTPCSETPWSWSRPFRASEGKYSACVSSLLSSQVLRVLRMLSKTSLCASEQSKAKALENVGPQLHLVTAASQPRENVWRRTEHPDRSCAPAHSDAGDCLGLSDHVEAVGEGGQAKRAAGSQGSLVERGQRLLVHHLQQAAVQLHPPAEAPGQRCSQARQRHPWLWMQAEVPGATRQRAQEQTVLPTPRLPCSLREGWLAAPAQARELNVPCSHREGDSGAGFEKSQSKLLFLAGSC